LSNITILYEDNHLLGVEKPPNIPVQEDISGDGDLLTYLKQYIREKYNKKGEAFLGLVHRLDRPVGGAMIFARTSKAASRLSEQIRTRQVKKIYIAVVEGLFQNSTGTYHHYLVKNRENNTVRVADKNTADSQEAILHYQVLAEREGISLVRIELETGRPHQIRVQFSHSGHPLMGDEKYGKTNGKSPTKHLALWSCQITFKHPVKDEIIHIESRPPQCYPWDLFSDHIDHLARGEVS
jgi:23S rRNA pseudouridine1911/1915/1917 synthase